MSWKEDSGRFGSHMSKSPPPGDAMNNMRQSPSTYSGAASTSSYTGTLRSSEQDLHSSGNMSNFMPSNQNVPNANPPSYASQSPGNSLNDARKSQMLSSQQIQSTTYPQQQQQQVQVQQQKQAQLSTYQRTPQPQQPQQSAPARPQRSDNRSAGPTQNFNPSQRNTPPDIHHMPRIVNLFATPKFYAEGYLYKRTQRDFAGRLLPASDAHALWDRWYMQLTTNKLCMWNAKDMELAAAAGTTVPPQFLRISDAHVVPAKLDDLNGAPGQFRSGFILNNDGVNRLIFAVEDKEKEQKWINMLRLADWEYSRLENMFTATLLGDRDMETVPSPLRDGRLEGQLEIRPPGEKYWCKTWVVLTAAGPAGSMRSRRRTSIFSTLHLGGGSNKDTLEEFACISVYASKKSKKPFLQIKDVWDCASIYPDNDHSSERNELIGKSTIFRVEGSCVWDDNADLPKSVSGSKIKAEGRKILSRDGGREGSQNTTLFMPEEPGSPGQMTMLHMIVAICDTFRLYGRGKTSPSSFSFDPRDPESPYFAYPIGAYRDNLFLDASLCMNLPTEERNPFKIKELFHSLLKRRMYEAMQNERKLNGNQNQIQGGDTPASTGTSPTPPQIPRKDFPPHEPLSVNNPSTEDQSNSGIFAANAHPSHTPPLNNNSSAGNAAMVSQQSRQNPEIVAPSPHRPVLLTAHSSSGPPSVSSVSDNEPGLTANSPINNNNNIADGLGASAIGQAMISGSYSADPSSNKSGSVPPALSSSPKPMTNRESTGSKYATADSTPTLSNINSPSNPNAKVLASPLPATPATSSTPAPVPSITVATGNGVEKRESVDDLWAALNFVDQTPSSPTKPAPVIVQPRRRQSASTTTSLNTATGTGTGTETPNNGSTRSIGKKASADSGIGSIRTADSNANKPNLRINVASTGAADEVVQPGSPDLYNSPVIPQSKDQFPPKPAPATAHGKSQPGAPAPDTQTSSGFGAPSKRAQERAEAARLAQKTQVENRQLPGRRTAGDVKREKVGGRNHFVDSDEDEESDSEKSSNEDSDENEPIKTSSKRMSVVAPLFSNSKLSPNRNSNNNNKSPVLHRQPSSTQGPRPIPRSLSTPVAVPQAQLAPAMPEQSQLLSTPPGDGKSPVAAGSIMEDDSISNFAHDELSQQRPQYGSSRPSFDNRMSMYSMQGMPYSGSQSMTQLGLLQQQQQQLQQQYAGSMYNGVAPGSRQSMMMPRNETFVNLNEPSDSYVAHPQNGHVQQFDANGVPLHEGFMPHGLLTQHERVINEKSAKEMEANSRETGAPLLDVPKKAPPPQTGLVGAIASHERDKKERGGLAGQLADRQREERQRGQDQGHRMNNSGQFFPGQMNMMPPYMNMHPQAQMMQMQQMQAMYMAQAAYMAAMQNQQQQMAASVHGSQVGVNSSNRPMDAQHGGDDAQEHLANSGGPGGGTGGHHGPQSSGQFSGGHGYTPSMMSGMSGGYGMPMMGMPPVGMPPVGMPPMGMGSMGFGGYPQMSPDMYQGMMNPGMMNPGVANSSQMGSPPRGATRGSPRPRQTRMSMASDSQHIPH